MASFRQFTRLMRESGLFSQAKRFVPIVAGTAGLAVLYNASTKTDLSTLLKEAQRPQIFSGVAAAAQPSSQPTVFSPGKKHALYLWIHLKPNADAKACAKAVSGIQKLSMSF